MQQPTRTQELMATISLYTQLLKELLDERPKVELEKQVLKLVNELNKELRLGE